MAVRRSLIVLIAVVVALLGLLYFLYTIEAEPLLALGAAAVTVLVVLLASWRFRALGRLLLRRPRSDWVPTMVAW